MSVRRKNFSASFKAKVALAAIKEEMTLIELSEKYEVHANVIRNWKNQFLESSELIFEDKGLHHSIRIQSVASSSEVRLTSVEAAEIPSFRDHFMDCSKNI